MCGAQGGGTGVPGANARVQDSVDMDVHRKHEKIKLIEINSYLTCYLCKGYLIDATTISECLHSFCRSCIIKFLQENCYCPVCEVIINKAKPCLKLDKTLQDIVYKLVPGLFVNEMYRRKEFFQSRPLLAPKVSPEERGEDTERTIFNPQDAISLSIEYISDDSAPGAIPSLTTTTPKVNGNVVPEEQNDNLMKRYLQCPGMCRIEVLKKFVRNKYNVDTNRFHIDILYKRVPLPDHYTLIDIGYIYSWKRNEPMKFFFRITDINKVTERFDYFDGKPATPPPVVPKATTRVRDKVKHERKKERASHKRRSEVAKSPPAVVVKKEEVVKTEKGEALPEVTEEIKKIQGGESVFTNITLNREENLEIITKIQKVSNKEGQPIGLNIIKNTVKKVQSELVPSDNKGVKTDEERKEEIEKSNFLKNIELTAKSSVVEKKEVKNVLPPLPVLPSPSSSSSQKRKNSSPVKNDKEKKTKTEKKPMKIIIQPKKNTDLQALIDNCKIPSSLSITLNEGGEGGARTPPSIPPVKNFIEILKLPDPKEDKKSSKQDKAMTSFQKIFEESINKKVPKPLDLTNSDPSPPKRKILEIASQLQKKSKLEQDKKMAIPRLPTQKTLKPSPKFEFPAHHQTSASMHSPTLGLNYTVSVGPPVEKRASPPSGSKKTGKALNGLSPNQLLEKYNIQNLAQLTASFNFNPTNFTALQHAMLLKQMDHRSWLSSQGPLLQYEKYLQSLSAQSKIMGNIKEN